MVNLQIIEEIESLRDEIRRHEHLYFVKAAPEISDREFDTLMHQLIEMEKQYPELITPDSPTQRVGEAVTSFNTVTHRVPMMSIENSYSLNDIADWLGRIEKLAGRSVFPVVAELKIDGVSGSFHYQNGHLKAAATRGNGVEGDLVSENVKTVRSLPLSISSPLDMDIRGEIYTPRSMLEKLNQERIAEGEEPFKNCRNLTAGTIKSLDPAVAASRGLQTMVYGIAQANELGFKTHSQTLEFLAGQGFKTNHAWRLCQSLEEIGQFIEEIDQKRRSYDFDIDGVVLKVDDLALQQELGVTSKSPRWVIAYKYPQERAISVLRQVIWQVGRSQLTPVAVLEPVELGGTTVSRASLHNIDQIREKDIRVGDRVIVEKAGYIIPYIVAAIVENRDGSEKLIEPPLTCPECGGPVSICTADQENSTTQVSCNNPGCRGVVARKLLHFITQMEIENVGPQLIEQLLERKIICRVEDLLSLDFATLLKLERMGEKSAEKIVGNISRAAKARLGQVIAGLGIANVGIVIADKIADFFARSFAAFCAADRDSLMKIDGISDRVADNIIGYLQSDEGKTLIEAINKWWQGPEESTSGQTRENRLNGQTFVVTGEAELPRKTLEKLIKGYGGNVKSSVSNKTSYLLIGSKETEDFDSSKKSRAIELKIPIISEWQLFEMVGTNIEEVKSNW